MPSARVSSSALAIVALATLAKATRYTTTYVLGDLPDTTEPGQFGTTDCSDVNSQSSECQIVYMNSLDDFCLWAPPKAGETIGDSEQYEVSWCNKDGYGTRTIPQGTFTGLHWVVTPDYVQLTGVGDFTKVNVKKGDEGGELDPHGYNTYGNPIGGLVFAGGRQIHEWDSFISDTQFCFRACTGNSNSLAAEWCEHVYDEMGCDWNMPSLTGYNKGFTVCEGESGSLPGKYVLADGTTSTFSEGDGHTPTAHPPGASSNCKTYATITGGTVVATTAPTTTSTSHKSTATSKTVSSSSKNATAAASASYSTIPSSASVTTKTSSIISSTHTSSVASSSVVSTSSLESSISSVPTAAPTTTSVISSSSVSSSAALQSNIASASASTSSVASGAQRIVAGGVAGLLGLTAFFALA